TFTRSRGPDQLDGAFGAVTAETDEGRERGFELARQLGLTPFELANSARPLYHAGAAIASNYLVTLHRVATDLFAAAGAPPEALRGRASTSCSRRPWRGSTRRGSRRGSSQSASATRSKGSSAPATSAASRRSA